MAAELDVLGGLFRSTSAKAGAEWTRPGSDPWFIEHLGSPTDKFPWSASAEDGVLMVRRIADRDVVAWRTIDRTSGREQTILECLALPEHTMVRCLPAATRFLRALRGRPAVRHFVTEDAAEDLPLHRRGLDLLLGLCAQERGRGVREDVITCPERPVVFEELIALAAWRYQELQQAEDHRAVAVLQAFPPAGEEPAFLAAGWDLILSPMPADWRRSRPEARVGPAPDVLAGWNDPVRGVPFERMLELDLSGLLLLFRDWRATAELPWQERLRLPLDAIPPELMSGEEWEEQCERWLAGLDAGSLAACRGVLVARPGLRTRLMDLALVAGQRGDAEFAVHEALHAICGLSQLSVASMLAAIESGAGAREER